MWVCCVLSLMSVWCVGLCVFMCVWCVFDVCLMCVWYVFDVLVYVCLCVFDVCLMCVWCVLAWGRRGPIFRRLVKGSTVYMEFKVWPKYPTSTSPRSESHFFSQFGKRFNFSHGGWEDLTVWGCILGPKSMRWYFETFEESCRLAWGKNLRFSLIWGNSAPKIWQNSISRYCTKEASVFSTYFCITPFLGKYLVQAWKSLQFRQIKQTCVVCKTTKSFIREYPGPILARKPKNTTAFSAEISAF